MREYSYAKTLLVAAAVCVVCSVIVSTAAVVLKPWQELNKENFRKRNILIAAGLLKADDESEADVAKMFKSIDARVVDLDTGEFVDNVSPEDLDEKAELKTPGEYIQLSDEEDIARIRRRSDLRIVYFLRRDGAIERIILPVRGKGLWSTMYGFLALDGDGTTIEAMEFYEHGETPGLGGEIENARWKAQWVGKKAFDQKGDVKIKVIKGKVETDSPQAVYQIDGLSGATITSRGVTNLVHFWLGEQGYGPLLARLKDNKKS